MVRHFPGPRRVVAAGSPLKVVEEFVGRLASGTETVSIARMRSPPGWSEPTQCARFDEYSLVLEGVLVVGAGDGPLTVDAGETVLVRAGEQVEYSTPGGAAYISVCVPAFDPGLVGREDDRLVMDAQAAPQSAEIRFEAHGPEAFDQIEPLWEELAQHHVACAHESAPAFEAEMADKTFEGRRADLLEKNRGRRLRIDLAIETATGCPVGYCVSSAAPGQVGEVESIAVAQSLRGQGIGSALLDRASGWMDGVGVVDQALSVFAGNARSLPFYARHGFLPRFHVLVRRE